jgi:nucleoside-diphosphate-sugar epimerase
MERVCGDTNVVACQTSAALSIPRFVFISAHKFNLGPLGGLLAGYYRGKSKAEAEVNRLYAAAGTILRPSFVYGSRTLPNGLTIPLSLIGAPLSAITSAAVFRCSLRHILVLFFF